jgi:hypothetical protein
MKILVTINHLEKWGGSEKFVSYLIKGFQELGHYVYLLSLIQGDPYLEMIKKGVIPFNSEIKYDIAVCTHNSTLVNIWATSILQICHGIYPYLEQPILGIDGHIAVSNEVKIRLKKHGISSEVIMNPIDIEKGFDVNTPYADVLSLCQGEEANNILKATCKSMGITFKYHNKHHNENKNIDSLISRSKLIIGSGRAVIEAISQRKQIILFDTRHYDGHVGNGLLTYDQLEDAAATNYSGRNMPVINSNRIKQEILQGLNRDFDNRMYDYIVQHHHYNTICKRIIYYSSECKSHFLFKKLFKKKRKIADLRTQAEKIRWMDLPVNSNKND